ncbi:protein kinase [Kitasatospora sp. NPDC057223]|uniref:serine/threonine-protein kinase n=1 Tax=Kitasatospora sp. NPDC057223 TaxID=3346055 RepID=UPI00362AF316
MNTGGPGTQLVDGRFELLERLGGGGMGLVWRARDTALHREVALKEVRPPDPVMLDGDPRAAAVLRERVLREARSLARLNHPNVVTIHHIVDVAEYPHPWLVMELVTGGSLHDRLTRGPMTSAEAARLGRGVLSALSAAHAAGIQHRDVKPGNVLLRPDGTPVLTDFGIAALRESTSLTTTGSLIGSPEYIAPERIRGEEGNPASDLWSLGMMLYVAVEGHHPLRRATSLATLAAVLDEPLPPAARSGPLAGVLSALLVRDPAARPDAAHLDRLLADAERVTADTFRLQQRPAQQGFPVAPAAPSAAPSDAPPSGPVPQDRTPTWAIPQPPRPRTRRTALRSGLALGVVLAAVAGWTVVQGLQDDSRTGGTGPQASASAPAGTTPVVPVAQSTAPQVPPPSSTPPAKAPADSANLLTPAGVRSVVAALTPVMGGTQVTRMTVYPEYAYAEAPLQTNPKLYDRFEYRGGKAALTPGFGGTLTNQKAVDLKDVDWDTLPALLQKGDNELGVDNPTSHYIIIDWSVFTKAPEILVYVSDSYGGGHLTADFKGKVTRTYPR